VVVWGGREALQPRGVWKQGRLRLSGRRRLRDSLAGERLSDNASMGSGQIGAPVARLLANMIVMSMPFLGRMGSHFMEAYKQALASVCLPPTHAHGPIVDGAAGTEPLPSLLGAPLVLSSLTRCSLPTFATQMVEAQQQEPQRARRRTGSGVASRSTRLA
jgi:hypothetical protein